MYLYIYSVYIFIYSLKSSATFKSSRTPMHRPSLPRSCTLVLITVPNSLTHSLEQYSIPIRHQHFFMVFLAVFYGLDVKNDFPVL